MPIKADIRTAKLAAGKATSKALKERTAKKRVAMAKIKAELAAAKAAYEAAKAAYSKA